MKIKMVMLFFFLSAVSACAEKEDIYKGMYEMSNQHQEMNDSELVQYPEEDPSSYEDYQRERKETLE